MQTFSTPTRSWFEQSFAEPTRVQRLGWPHLTRGESSLLVAPTGSGKTLAAFLWAIDQCTQLPPDAPEGVRVLYVSPLKALVYDIERNLRAPLVGISRAAERLGLEIRQPRIDVRTGDTPARDRRQQLKHPGDILVTTPESLFLLLGSQAAATLDTVHTVIVDEIHVFVPSKRGSHLALSLERLAERTVAAGESEPQRIGLSATVRPPDEVARFLGGDRTVEIVDAAEPAHIELNIVVPVPDMDAVDPVPVETASPPAPTRGGPILAEHNRAERSGGWPRGAETTGVWPSIYPQLLDRILEHRSTIVFTNSRGLCERLSQRLNDLYLSRLETAADANDERVQAPTEELVRAHHGSISHESRAEIEEALKAGRLRAIIATSSLELGIDMGAVDLVILIESPGSVARGLQRVGRAGHSVGEISQGLLFPKFKGDLLECAVVGTRMLEGNLEPIRMPSNPLDVLAQQIAAMCCDGPRSVEEIQTLARRAAPYRTLSNEALVAVLDMLSGRFPSDDFADLRPRINWDRTQDLLSARRGTKMVTLLNAGTIPDRGLFSVHLGADGPRIGELDEEMVYETRAGDVIVLGASSWRVAEITTDRVLVQPAPGEHGRMPFWHGDGPGRPIELGRAIGAFLHEATTKGEEELAAWIHETTPLDDLATGNLVSYLAEQREATGAFPSDRTLVVERFRDELGDWRVCLLSPFGARVHAPWAMALEQILGERFGFAVETMYTDDGIVLRFADTDDLPPVDELFPDPDAVEDLVVDQVGSSALFATHFRENAARSLLMPKRFARKRTPLWLQRLRSKTLLASVRRYSSFPVVLETYRECLRDIFDVPALVDLLRRVQRREVRVVEVETAQASPFARSLVYAYVAQYLYEQDSPLAERKAQALTLDRNLLRELLGDAELRELLDPQAIEEVEAELQGLHEERQARSADDLHDLLRRCGDLSPVELEQRSNGDLDLWLEQLLQERRIGRIQLAGEARYVAVEDVALYRDALGVQPPVGLPEGLLEATEASLERLVRRWARTHAPFTSAPVATRWGLLPAQLEPVLQGLVTDNVLMSGGLSPGGEGTEWCDLGILRRIKRRTLARLRGEVAPVEARALARFLPTWHELQPVPATDDSSPRENVVRRALQRSGQAPLRAATPQRLESALAQLEGLPLPFSVLIGEVLPSRVPGFQVEDLDQLAAAGELVWVGCGALGPRDGRIALYRRDNLPLLVRSAAGIEDLGEPDDVHDALLHAFESAGASFLTELQREVETSLGRELSHAELEGALWDLVWAGAVTNDTLLPLRTLTTPRRRPSSRAAGRSTVRVRRAPTLRRPGSQRAPRAAGGRWSLVAAQLDSAVADTEWSWALSHQLLERYGLLAPVTARAEEVPGGFSALAPTLRALEETGRVRRGYFLEGLSGRQYALPGAVERLRAERADELGSPEHGSPERHLYVLPVLDPANPYGSLLEWPERRRPDGPRPRRVAGAWVALLDGEPLFFLESSLRALVTFPGLTQPSALDRARDALRAIARRQRKRSLRLTKIDGLPARESDLLGALQQHGFVLEDIGVRVGVG